jgi:hypothetical protein
MRQLRTPSRSSTASPRPRAATAPSTNPASKHTASRRSLRSVKGSAAAAALNIGATCAGVQRAREAASFSGAGSARRPFAASACRMSSSPSTFARYTLTHRSLSLSRAHTICVPPSQYDRCLSRSRSLPMSLPLPPSHPLPGTLRQGALIDQIQHLSKTVEYITCSSCTRGKTRKMQPQRKRALASSEPYFSLQNETVAGIAAKLSCDPQAVGSTPCIPSSEPATRIPQPSTLNPQP